MKNKNSKLTIGLIIENVYTEFAKDVVSSIVSSVPKNKDIEIVVIAGKYVDIGHEDDMQSRYKNVYNSIYRLEELCKFDGLLVALGSMAKVKKQIITKRFVENLPNVPKVFFVSELEGMVNVNYDNEPGIKEAVDYLVNICNFSKFGMLGGREDNLDSCRRKAIFENCLKKYKLELKPENYEATDMSVNTVAESERLLNRCPDLEAIFCVNDESAVGLYEAMKKKRLIPGKDIYVFGFDNTRKAGYMIPSLATIGAESVTLGQKSLELLLKMIDGEHVESEMIPTRLYGRDSCDYETHEYTPMEMMNIDEDFILRMFDDCFYRYRYVRNDENSVDLRRLFCEFITRILKAMKNRYMSEEEYEETRELIGVFFSHNVFEYTDSTKMLKSMEKFQNSINALQRNPSTTVMINRLFMYMRSSAILALSRRVSSENYSFASNRIILENFLTECSDLSSSSTELINEIVGKFDRLGLDDAALFMFESPAIFEKDSAHVYPDEVSLRCYTKAGELFVIPSERQKSPITEIFKREELSSKKRGFIAFPIIFKDYIYGILVCVLTEDIVDKGEYAAGQLGRTIYISHTQESDNTEKEKITYTRIAETLATKYDVIYHVNSATGEYTEYRTDKKTGKFAIKENGGDFFDDISKESHFEISPEDRKSVLKILDKESLKKDLESRKKIGIDFKIIDGEVSRNMRLTVLWSSDKVHFVIGLENIDEEVKKEEEQLRELTTQREFARKDELTGVKNKNAYREFEDLMQKRISGGSPISPFAIIVCDINNLKIINDTAGHKVGDEYIIEASKLICETFTHSPVYRIGGDEFVVVLNAGDYINREKLLKQIRAVVIKNIGKKEGVVIATGIADYDSINDKTLSDVFERADAKMYENKKFLKYI
ncbi:MAG: GGDEF domain-containing protein [Lachnospiraceae bacterium]|nr:GGDEF domain-containing protein [Lachnospiraceae bacterium]